MILLQRIAVMNLENAMRGARNPLNSWARSDSYYDEHHQYVLGPQDRALAQRLCRAGSDHRKFIRQIFVSVDITAPLYWWKEFDTYKVATVANSTSTMHKIHVSPFSFDCTNTGANGACDCLFGATPTGICGDEREKILVRYDSVSAVIVSANAHCDHEL